MRPTLIITLLYLCTASPVGAAGPSFRVRFDADIRADPATGRLVVYLIREGAQVGSDSPADGPFWYDAQPLYGIDVKDLKPGDSAIVDDSATSFGGKLSELPGARYRVQAVLDMHHDDSSWKREPGNLSSAVSTVELKPDATTPHEIVLNTVVAKRQPATQANAEVFEIRSELLSKFRGRDTFLRAGVVPPEDFDPSRSYPAIYEVPGFGGNHLEAFGQSVRMSRSRGPARELFRNAFYIVLDPESPNGHTLFADSDVNGPCGRALVEELIPALEAKYKLIAQPSARLVRGHSSGGWSVLWLATQYPQTFGACWSSAPDPVDFRRFELIDIYKDDNAYFDAAAKEVPSTHSGGKVTLSVRGENQQEEVLGTANSSAQQWDSWQAVYGSRDATGWPKPLFDAATGKLDHTEAEHYKRYDISLLLREDPRKYGPIFLQRVRLVCGDMDDFYLNEAVALLKAEVDKLQTTDLPEGRNGYVKLVPGLNHGTIFMSDAMRAIPQEMLDHLKRHGHAK